MMVPAWHTCLERWGWAANGHCVREMMRSGRGGNWAMMVPAWHTCLESWGWAANGHCVREIFTWPKGWLCEKGPDAAAITYQLNHLPGSFVKSFDKRFQLQERAFFSQKPSQLSDMSQLEDGQQLNVDAVSMEGFPRPVFVKKSRAAAAGLKDFKPQPLANPCDKRFQFQQRRFLFHKHSLPYDLPRRYCSSKPVPKNDQQLNGDAIDLEGFPGPGPGDITEFVKKISVASAELKKELDIGVLRAEFNRDIRPILASNCLILPRAVGHQMTTAFLNGQAHGSSKREPLYLSSLDIMIAMKLLKEWQRKPLLDFIIKRRVLVADEWKETHGNIELLEYEFEESQSDFVRGECDASFQESVVAPAGTTSGAIHRRGQTVSGAVLKSGSAKLAFVIWRGRRLLWADMFDGISCDDNNHAEILAALALLKKCEESNYLNVRLWSDSTKVIRVINGSETIELNDKNRDTYLLLRSMPKKFTKLVAVHKPRELMFLPDQLLRIDGVPGAILDEALELQSPYLSGCPLFSITHNTGTRSIIKKFATFLRNKKNQNYNYSNDSIFFCKVKRGHKFEEFQRLQRALEPSCVELILDISKPHPQEIMVGFTKSSICGTTVSLLAEMSTDGKQRKLFVVWDVSVPMAHYYREDSCTIILAEDKEVQELKKRGISEINPSTYFHLNRVVFRYS